MAKGDGESAPLGVVSLAGASGVVVVEAGDMWDLIKSGTEVGVTLSMKVKAGRRRIVVGR